MILPAELETPAQIWVERYYGGFGGRRNFTPVTVQAEGNSGRLRHSRATVRSQTGDLLRTFSIYGVGAYGAGANMAFRRSSLIRHGLFDTALGTGTPARGGEDLAMLVAVLWSGGRIGYEPAAVVNHRHRQEWEQLLHQLRGNGLGFTAMLTSAVFNDRRHLLALCTQIPLAARRLTGQSLRRLTGRGPEKRTPEIDDSFPRDLVISELRGYPQGPAAYARSRRLDRSEATVPNRTGRGRRTVRRWPPGSTPRPQSQGDVLSQPADQVLSQPAPPPDPRDAPMSSALSGVVSRLGEDVAMAWQQMIYCSIGGSPWLPRIVRRLVFTIAGASVQSSPGIKFILAGRARNLTLGRGVYMNRGVFIEAIAPVTIGDECALGMQTLILTSHHPIDDQGRWGAEVGRPVTIGNRVWIGARATILPGAVLDSDVVIAAGAVVSGHARSGGIYGGVPARRILEIGPE